MKFVCNRFAWILYFFVSFAFQPIAGSNTPKEASSTYEKPNRSIKINSAVTAYEYILKNGLTVYLLPNKKAPVTNVFHWVKAGSLHEKPGVTGIAHLFEHMMFRPLKKSEPGFFDKIREIGGDGNASTRFESTVYTSTVPNENLEKLLKIESDRFQNLKVDDDLLNIERKAVWSEYSTKIDSNPILDLWHATYHAGFPGHPFGWTIIGEREDLDKIKATDCTEFFNKNYVPKNIGLFISGDFDAKKTIQSVDSLYGSWKSGTTNSLPAAYNHTTGLVRAEGKLASNSKNVLLGFRIPMIDSQNFLRISLLAHIFFSSEFSLAKRRFIHGEKFSSSVEDFNTDSDSGLLKVLVQLLPNVKTERLISEIPNLVIDFKNFLKMNSMPISRSIIHI